MEGVTEEQARSRRARCRPIRASIRRSRLADELLDFPRHLSQHVGGFVITETRLDEIVPIENAAMEDRTVIEWDKDDLETLEILKVDVLGAWHVVVPAPRVSIFSQQHYGVRHTLASIPEEEPAVYNMLSRADSIGVFQVESRAQMSMLPRLRPKKFYDLVIEVAIVRPGPIQGNMVHPYLRRKEGMEPVDIPSPDPRFGDKDELKDVLDRTLGRSVVPGTGHADRHRRRGFQRGRGQQLRRAMATFRRTGRGQAFQKTIYRGHVRARLSAKIRRELLEADRGLRRTMAFPKAMPRALRYLVYASAWIKCHYPDVFAAALLNSQPMGFYATAQLVRDAQEHGVEVRPVDVNYSDWDCTLEKLLRRRASLHPRHATMSGDILTTHALSASAFARSTASPRNGARKSKASAAAASIPSAISGCAPACRPRRCKSLPMPTPSIRSASAAATRYGR